jgi:hypothetical protein
MSGGLPQLAGMFGFNPASEGDTDEDAKDGGTVERQAIPGAKLGRTRSRSKVDQPGNATDRVLLVRAFQASVNSERGRNYRNGLPKLKQYFFNKSNSSQVFAFAFFWVGASCVPVGIHIQQFFTDCPHVLGKYYCYFFCS